jgi:hypothetical protein
MSWQLAKMVAKPATAKRKIRVRGADRASKKRATPV